MSKTKPTREPIDRRLWNNVHDTEYQTYQEFLAAKAAQDTGGMSPVVMFARDFAKAAIPVFLLINVPRVLRWTFRSRGKAKKDSAQAAREQMAQQQQAMRQQLLQQQLATARAQAAAAKPAAAEAPKPADKPATAGAGAAAQAADDKARLVERLRQLKQAKLEQERKKAAEASAASTAPKGLGAALQKPKAPAAESAALSAPATAAAGAPKGLGGGLGAPKGLGSGLGAPKGMGVGLEGPKGLGGALGPQSSQASGIGAPKGLGAGLLPQPKQAEAAAEEKAPSSSNKAEPRGLGGLALPAKPKGLGAGLGGGLPIRGAAAVREQPASPAAAPAAAGPSGLGAALLPRAGADGAEADNRPEAEPGAAAAVQEQEEAEEAAGDDEVPDAAPPTPQQQEAPLTGMAAASHSPAPAPAEPRDEASAEQDDVVAPATPTPEATTGTISREATPPPATPDLDSGSAATAEGHIDTAAEHVEAVHAEEVQHASDTEVPAEDSQPEQQTETPTDWDFRGATPEAVPLPDGSGVLVLRRMAPNNSCLFNAVDYLVYGQRAGGQGGVHAADEGGMQLRLVVANEVEDFPDRYNEAFLGLPNGKYVDWIQQPSSWGGGIELAVLASHFTTELAAWNIETSACHVFGEESGYKKQGMLIYDGKHYDVLAIAKSHEANPIYDETTFDPASHRFKMVAAAAQKLVELQNHRKKGLLSIM